MRNLRTGLRPFLLLSLAAPVLGQGDGPVVSVPATREATLATVARLVAVPLAPAAAAIAKDPFYPAATDLTDLTEKVKADPSLISPQERLEQIAAQINPTGSVTLGGEPYLLFTEKRQKIGDKVTVSIDDVEYEVEIVNIDKSRFRLRYNNLETTRSIK